MTWKEERKKYENEGVTYLAQIVKDGWTVTPTTDPWTTWDATISNSTSEYKCENKVRRYDLNQLETIFLAKKKLDPGVKYYVEHFPRNSTALVITYETITKGLEDGTIQTKKITVPKGQFKYESGVDTTMECLANLVIPKSLFQVYPICPVVTACTAQADRQKSATA
jgi:hypothetical protein